MINPECDYYNIEFRNIYIIENEIEDMFEINKLIVMFNNLYI